MNEVIKKKKGGFCSLNGGITRRGGKKQMSAIHDPIKMKTENCDGGMWVF